MKFILGKKLNMEQVFTPDGTAVSVTKVLAGPCLVMQKKNLDKDGYLAVQCAFQEKKKNSKALMAKFKKISDKNYQYLREFRFQDGDVMFEKIQPGDLLKAEIFTVGDVVVVSAISKGKGFQGVVKRHGFKGGKKSHGHKDQLRMPGSIGSTGPARVFKGMRMGGQTGNEKVTTTGLEIIDVDTQDNILYIKGSIPGARNGLVSIITDGEFEVVKEEKKVDGKSEVQVFESQETKESAQVNEAEKSKQAEKVAEIKEDKKNELEKKTTVKPEEK